jgi:hypothetical protein
MNNNSALSMNMHIPRALVITALVFAAAGCGGSSDSDGDTVAADNSTTVPANTVDISDAVFSERSGDCIDYIADYAASALDIQRSLGFTADVTITGDNDSCDLTSNNIPNHDFNDAAAKFATNVATVEQSFSIPRNPVLAANPTPLEQFIYNAIMLNGVPLDLLSAGCYDPTSPRADADGNTPIGCTTAAEWLLEPLSTEGGFGVDSHNAHVQPDGSYHYHGNPDAMFDDFPGPDGSPVIGFAADGFPIFGSYFYAQNTGSVRKATTGYTLKAGARSSSTGNPGGNYDGTYVADWEWTNAGDLDECNGMTVAGQYGYYVTDTYPWVMACHSGTPDDSFSKGSP